MKPNDSTLRVHVLNVAAAMQQQGSMT